MKKLILLGGGGHALVLLEALRQNGDFSRLLGVIAPDTGVIRRHALDVLLLTADKGIIPHPADEVELINGIGSGGEKGLRRSLFERYRRQGYGFATVIHPAATIASGVSPGEGGQIMAGAVIQPGTTLGENVIVNTRAVLEHECRIADHVHIAPGATLCGGIQIGEDTHIGAGATIIQGLRIGSGVMVGAGAVVVRDLPPASRAVGVPARPLTP